LALNVGSPQCGNLSGVGDGAGVAETAKVALATNVEVTTLQGERATLQMHIKCPRVAPSCMAQDQTNLLLGLGALTRRRAMVCIAASGLPAFAATPSSAAPLLIHPVLRYAQPVRIALSDFLASSPAEADPAVAILQIVTANLKRSEKLALIDQAAFIEKITNFDLPPRFSDWRAIRADALVTGRVARRPDGRLHIAFRIWDVRANMQLSGQQYFITPDSVRAVADIISDAIYERAILLFLRFQAEQD
jgi:hypothetical protein